MREAKDYIYTTFGLISCVLGWAAFLLSYQITIGDTTDTGAIIYYAMRFPIQRSYLIINAILMISAIKILGPRSNIKATYAILMPTFLLQIFQVLVDNYIQAPDTSADGEPLLLGSGQGFMTYITGAVMCGVGLGTAFNYSGSTGGTDTIVVIVSKYKDVSLGRVTMICNTFIISSYHFMFHDWCRVIFSFVTPFIIGAVLDRTTNSACQSVQFLISSKKYDKITDRTIKDTGHGVTAFSGTGRHNKNDVKILIVLAEGRQLLDILRLAERIDSNAFISRSSVIGVYGEGLDQLKMK